MTADVAVHFLISYVVLQYGLPRVIHTDNGTHFAGSFEAACEQLQIKLKKSTPYYPRSHGKIERVHRLVLDRIRRTGEVAAWPHVLPYAVFAVNSRRMTWNDGSDRSTSPLELLTGIRARNEAEANIVSLLEEPTVPEDPHARLAILGAVRDDLSKRMEDASLAALKPDSRRGPVEGDQVLVWSDKQRDGRGSKLNPYWIGPAILTWKGDLGGCEVYFAETGKKMRVNISRVKKYWQ